MPQGAGAMGVGPMGTSQQPQGPQVDWQALNADLSSAVASGAISVSEAEFILDSAKQQYGGGQDMGTQIVQALQTNPEQAKGLIIQGLLSGEIDSATAKMVLELTESGGDTMPDLNTTQTKYYNVANTADGAIGLLSNMSGVTGQEMPGIGKGLTTSIQDTLNTTDPKMLEYRNKIASIDLAVSNLIAGTNISKSEARRLKKLVPTMNDSISEAQSKLKELLTLGIGGSGVSVQQLGASTDVLSDYMQ